MSSFPEAPPDGLAYSRNGLTQLWEPALAGVWQDTYQVATNVPDLTLVTPAYGFTWTAITADPLVPEVITIALPGIAGGTLIRHGDLLQVIDGVTPTWVHIKQGEKEVYIGDAPPPGAFIPDRLWWDSVGLQLYIAYDDGTSQQWVAASHTGGGGNLWAGLYDVDTNTPDLAPLLPELGTVYTCTTNNPNIPEPTIIALPGTPGIPLGTLLGHGDFIQYVDATLGWMHVSGRTTTDFGTGLSFDENVTPPIVHLTPAGWAPQFLGGVYSSERSATQGLDLAGTGTGELSSPLATDLLAGSIVEPPPDDQQYVRMRNAAGVSAWVPQVGAEFGTGLSYDENATPPIVHLQPAGAYSQFLGGVYVPVRSATQAAEVSPTAALPGELTVPLATDLLAGSIVEPPPDDQQYVRMRNAAGVSAWVPQVGAEFGIGLAYDENATPPIVNLTPAGWAPQFLGGVYGSERSATQGLDLAGMGTGEISVPLATDLLAGSIVEPLPDGLAYARTRSTNGVSTWTETKSLYQGIWNVANNNPPLNTVTRFPGWMWIASTLVPSIPETPPPGIAGLDGLAIYEGDHVVCQDGNAFVIVRGVLPPNYRGIWNVATNTPPIDAPPLGNNKPNWMWVAKTVDPLVPELAPPTMPGIGGLTIREGDHIVWDDTNNVFALVSGNGGMQEPPDDKLHARRGGATPEWVHTVDEAPLDGLQYARNDGGWVPTSSVTVADVAPAFAKDALWWDSIGAQLYIAYDDGTSEQWVLANNPPGTKALSIADAPPVPMHQQFWWDSTNLNLYVGYDDGDSTQWVIALPPGGSGGGIFPEAPADGAVYGRNGQSSTWIAVTPTGVGIPEAPTDGSLYGRNGQQNNWERVAPAATAVTEAPSDGTPYARQDAGWVNISATTGGVEEAPINGTAYSRQDAGWVASTAFIDAPSDGTPYARQDAGWVPTTATTGGVGEAPTDGQLYLRNGQTTAWVANTTVAGITEAPIDGSPYSRQDAGWVASTTFIDAPSDNKTYGRKNAAWSDISLPIVPVGPLPATGVQGQLHFNNADASLYVFYDDGSSSQWIEVSAP